MVFHIDFAAFNFMLSYGAYAFFAYTMDTKKIIL